MTQKSTQNTSDELTPHDEEVQLAEALEHLRIMLSAEMKDLRARRNLTQKEVAQRMGVEQPWISKLENADSNAGIESILRYLKALGADLIVGILENEKFLPVSEAAEVWWEQRAQGGVHAAVPKTVETSVRKPEKVVRLEEKYKSSPMSRIVTDKITASPVQIAG